MRPFKLSGAKSYLSENLNENFDIQELIEAGYIAAYCVSKEDQAKCYFCASEVKKLLDGQSLSSLLVFRNSYDARQVTLVENGELPFTSKLNDRDFVGSGSELFSMRDLRIEKEDLDRFIASKQGIGEKPGDDILLAICREGGKDITTKVALSKAKRYEAILSGYKGDLKDISSYRKKAEYVLSEIKRSSGPFERLPAQNSIEKMLSALRRAREKFVNR